MTLQRFGIIRHDGLEDIVFEEQDPKLIFGLNSVPSQKKERRMIGNAMLKTGMEVHSTPDSWPNDLYVTNNGLVVAEQDHGKLGHGGHYIFGEDFILVSGHIKDDLLDKLGNNQHLMDFVGSKQIYFIPPFDGEVHVALGNRYRPWHIDVTIGYVPGERILSIDGAHFEQQKDLFQRIARNHGLRINVTPSKDGMVANYLPNNFFSFQRNGSIFAIGSRYDNPLWLDGHKVSFIPTEEDIFDLPLKNQGSVRCAINIAPTAKLWDALGIEYRKYEGSRPH